MPDESNKMRWFEAAVPYPWEKSRKLNQDDAGPQYRTKSPSLLTLTYMKYVQLTRWGRLPEAAVVASCLMLLSCLLLRPVCLTGPFLLVLTYSILPRDRMGRWTDAPFSRRWIWLSCRHRPYHLTTAECRVDRLARLTKDRLLQ